MKKFHGSLCVYILWVVGRYLDSVCVLCLWEINPSLVISLSDIARNESAVLFIHPLNGIPSLLVVCAHVAHTSPTNKHKKACCSAIWPQKSVWNLWCYSVDLPGCLSSSPMKIGVVEAKLCLLFGLTSKSASGGRTLHNVTSVTYFKRYRKSEDNVPSRFFHSTRGTEKI